MWPRNVRGMTMDQRDDPRVLIRSDVILPVRDTCGDMALDREMTIALDDALEASYMAKRRKMQRAIINDLLKRGFTHWQIERFISARRGRLSKLRDGEIAPASTFRLLYLLHEMPDPVIRAISRLDPKVLRRQPEPIEQE